MKKLLSMFFLLSLVFGASCTNLNEVNTRLDDHEKRIAALEAMVKTANDNVKALKQLFDAQKKKLGIGSWTPLADGSGYELIMSDGSKIIIKNGKPGERPIIGVKEEDGVFYWTINGVYLLDESGNKVVANGSDGNVGITPMLRVNTDGYWEVSYDKGANWTLVYDENGNPVLAKGSSDVKDFEITEDDDYVYITFKGKKFTIPKDKNTVTPEAIALSPEESDLEIGATLKLKVIYTPENASANDLVWSTSDENVATVADGEVTAIGFGTAVITVKALQGALESTATIRVKEPHQSKLAIEYLTEYNINKDGTGFAENHIGRTGGYFNWNEAMDKFAAEKNFRINGEGYHLPTFKEWCSITPKEIMYVELSMPDKIGIIEEVTIGGSDYTYTSDFRFPGNQTFYGLRFRGGDNKQLSAWRYEYTDNPAGAEEKMLRITVRSLSSKDGLLMTLDDISTSDFWSKNNENDIQRVLPAAGYLNKEGGEPLYYNVYGQYWSSTEDNENLAIFLLFSDFLCTADYAHQKVIYNSVRLFKNN